MLLFRCLPPLIRHYAAFEACRDTFDTAILRCRHAAMSFSLFADATRRFFHTLRLFAAAAASYASAVTLPCLCFFVRLPPMLPLIAAAGRRR